MTNTLPEGLETLAGAWREFQTWTPVKLGLLQDDRHATKSKLLPSLLDAINVVRSCGLYVDPVTASALMLDR